MFKRLLQSFKQLLERLAELPRQLLRLIRLVSRRSGQPPVGPAGFVLPTVTMVILVVVLTSTTLVFRSIDRARNASNFRVNQVVMNAAAPAVERAKAKVDALFSDTSLPRGTPSDAAITGVFGNDRYNLDDEVRLQVAFDYGNVNGEIVNVNNGDGTIQEGERITTAWRFPVDTDNNGRYDAFTLYGVYYLSNNSRARQPMEARTRPQVLNAQNRTCEAAAGTSASLVGSDGWFNQEGILKKAFYVYVATVPITSLDVNQGFVLPTAPPYNDANRYEVATGNRGFTALEYQQDRARIPLGNNAIIYEDDLDLSSGTEFRINGRIIANSNLFASEPQNQNVHLYQDSSDESCFYEEENGKILVGGNVGTGRIHDNAASGSTIQVDLFRGRSENVGGGDNNDFGISSANQSTRSISPDVAYNNKAYEERIAYLVQEVIREHPTQPNLNSYTLSSNDPSTVKNAVKEQIEANSGNESELVSIRADELEVWFRNRTRRVPNSEVPYGTSENLNFRPYQDYGVNGNDDLRPISAWIQPLEGNVRLSYRKERFPATNPKTREVEELLGDRVQIGNNLPAIWWNEATNAFATDKTENTLHLENKRWWTATGGSNSDPENRYRRTQTQRLEEPGATGRNGFWEASAAAAPAKKNESVGGLRVVTGAGIYLPAELRAADNPLNNRANGRPRAEYVVWPDTMPQPPNPSTDKLVNDAELALHPYRQKIIERYETYNGKAYPVYLDDNTPDLATSRPDLAADAVPNILRDFTPRRPYLKMRASVVYHYSYPDNANQGKEPIACVSNFYDPTDWVTAQNASVLPQVSGQLANANPLPSRPAGRNGFSNNGVTYSPRRNSFGVNFNDAQLIYQANLVYPNGRPVNPALKKALEKGNQNNLTLPDRSAIDATYCALDILANRNNGVNEVPIGGFRLVHGAIQELAFLDGRQIKSTEKPKRAGQNQYNNSYTIQRLTGGQSDFNTNGLKDNPQYDLQMEHRLPMEIRTTVIDLKRLRLGNGNSALTVPGPTGDQETYPDTEYMLPMSGIVYATRDDALPDASDRPTDPEPLTGVNFDANNPVKNLVNNEPTERNPVDKISRTDYWLDPTRRPNGIMLINGRELNREPDNRFVPEIDEPGLTTEKGLTLASNLPVYIKAEAAPSNNPNDRPGFNIHKEPGGRAVEEFRTFLAADWGNFYSRVETDLNPQFACRKNDPRLTNCTVGDTWRVANVLSDAMTLLSERYRFGFRNEGDYDIRNNQSDNLFRDPIVPSATGNKRLHQVFTVASQALRPTGRAMIQEYEATNVNSFPGADFNAYYDAAISNYVNHLSRVRGELGFKPDASLAINGLSSRNASGAFPTALDLTDRSYSIENGNLNDVLDSSYFNNLANPVIRRIEANRYEYLMETCFKLPVSQCTNQDWYAYQDSGGTLYRASDLIDTPLQTLLNGSEFAGTTAKAPSTQWQHFPRRVAFLRATDNILGAPVSSSANPTVYDVYYPNLNQSSNLVENPGGQIFMKNVDFKRGIGPSNTREYWAPTPDQIILNRDNATNRQRPVPIAIKSGGSAGIVSCYIYDGNNLEFNYSAEGAITGTTGNHVCGRFDSIRNNLVKLTNTLWYATGSNINTPNLPGNKSDYDGDNRPLALENPSQYNDMYGSDHTTLTSLDKVAFIQPSLVPVMQVNSATRTDYVDNPNPLPPYSRTNWLPKVNGYGNNIHFNLIMATGDTPTRNGESNGLLANLPRFLENWGPDTVTQTTEIKGSFIQLQRSAYATAPFHQFYGNGYNYGASESLYGYRQRFLSGNGKFAHYSPPGRQWGFDVGILSQLPDLFSQQFGLPSTDEPNEFYREASRRDDWVRTLLCAVELDLNNTSRTTGLRPVINRDQRPEAFCQNRARAAF